MQKQCFQLLKWKRVLYTFLASYTPRHIEMGSVGHSVGIHFIYQKRHIEIERNLGFLINMSTLVYWNCPPLSSPTMQEPNCATSWKSWANTFQVIPLDLVKKTLRALHGRLEIRSLSSSVGYFSCLEDKVKFLISKRSHNVLFIV